MNDEQYMRIAIDLAKQGVGNVNPNPLVGSIVIKDNEIIGRGWHKQCGGPHAEVFALDEAGDNAKGATIYVTLEPCSHYGKTPPCAKKIIDFGIKKCVIANLDPNPLVAGNGIKMLREAGIEVITGVLDKEAKKLNPIFFKYINHKEPYIFLKTAITLDGKIATRSGSSKWITNELSRERVQYLRHKYMGIMIGINTLLSDNPRLTARIKNGNNPYRLIVDPHLRSNPDLNVFINNEDKKTIIITSILNKDHYNYKRLISLNVDFIFMEKEIFNFKNMFREIGQKGIDSVLVEGGSGIISSCFKQDLFDAGEIFIAPKIVGDKEAIPFVDGFNPQNISDGIILKNTEFKIYGDNISIQFKR